MITFNGTFLGSPFANATTHFVRFEIERYRLEEHRITFLYSLGS